MPRRDDIRKILLIGSGPIVIGQACEFDYSGTQGAKSLHEEGYEVVLVNSNPATIMTDPEFADRTYVEPLVPEVLERILEREKPDAILPTLGGQTALNLAMELYRSGALERHRVRLIGASPEAIAKAEDRQLFKEAMKRIGLDVPLSGTATTLAEAEAILEQVGFPAILRPSFTLGGTGGSIAYNKEEFAAKVSWGIQQSPSGQVLVEQSVLNWKEFELEVVRDAADNFAVVCSIENFDPMGIHTGDSITVAPAMTLTDKEYQRMRDAARAVMVEIGVDTGGSNIQFAVDPATGRMVVIEMNPRVSRSSALASKATGYPIAKVAAKLAVGYRLDELRNDITRETSAAFEPAIDYVVVKIPRFAFEKFTGADPRLGTQMKSVGEVMAIGRTFRQALQKAARSLETGKDGLTSLLGRVDYRTLARQRFIEADLLMESVGEPPLPETLPPATEDEQRAALKAVLPTAVAERLFHIGDALRLGLGVDEIHALTHVDRWFLENLRAIVERENEIRRAGTGIGAELLAEAKRDGFSDGQIARLAGLGEAAVRELRRTTQIVPTFGRVDTCAAEFAAFTPYLYSTYETESESGAAEGRKVIILGGGPNRIGQGIEFDYCCVHAAFALRAEGFTAIMVNCNPETVSTDWDTSDRLYFEPLTLEDVLAIVAEERKAGSVAGLIVQFGGQTPLKLAVALEKAGVPILGTSADAIDRAEDRERFDALLGKLGLSRPESGVARSIDEACGVAGRIGYPVLVRPSYVLGGRAMEVCYDPGGLGRYMRRAIDAGLLVAGGAPILIDKFLRDAIEVDVDALSDGRRVVVAGVMQHIEEAGIHSGDSACVLPPHSLPSEIVGAIEAQTKALALELGVVGLMNVQFAVQAGQLFVLEVNPRASRTVPFVSKATGLPIAKIAARVMAGRSLDELGVGHRIVPRHVSVKESVFPFAKFPGVDTILGPEMKSTGEVMGIDERFDRAFYKALLASGQELPTSGTVFISVRDADKAAAAEIARSLNEMGFSIVATGGTASAIEASGVPAQLVNKVAQGRPHIVDLLKSGGVDMVINTTIGAQAIHDSYSIRRQTLLSGIAYFTTLSGAAAAVEAIRARQQGAFGVRSLQEYAVT